MEDIIETIEDNFTVTIYTANTMTDTTFPQETSLTCRECGSPMLLIAKKTEIEEGQHSPVTTSVYNCSDDVCQKNIDKKTAARIKNAHDLEEARKDRLTRIKENKAAQKLAKEQAA